jgi:hypothetical protein
VIAQTGGSLLGFLIVIGVVVGTVLALYLIFRRSIVGLRSGYDDTYRRDR